jgi:hypothetical protein
MPTIVSHRPTHRVRLDIILFTEKKIISNSKIYAILLNAKQYILETTQ